MTKMNGFTLIELLVTIAVIAILATIAVPSFNSILNNQKLNASTRELMSKIAEARTQAVTLRQTTGVCLSTVSDCASALSITTNRVYIAQLEKNIVAGTGSATQIAFRIEGIPITTAKFTLTRNGQSRCVEVGITGDTYYKEGACT